MILINIIIISLACNGWYIICHNDKLFNGLRKWYIDIAGGIENANGSINWTYNIDNKYIHPKKVFLYKPLFGCIVCMSSIWGTLGFVSLYDLTIDNIRIYPIIILSVACCNLLISKIYDNG